VEVLLGVARANDPAAQVARTFLRRDPELRARLLVTDPDPAVNPRVAQLVGLEAVATGSIVVVSDSNVRVPSGYLCALVRELEHAELERSLGAALENLQLGAVVLAGMVAAEPLMSPLLVASLTALVSPSRTTLALVLAVAVVQTVLALASVRASRGRALAWKYAPLEVVRTYLLFGCWLSAVVTTRLAWRGHPFRLLAGSVIVPAPRGSCARRKRGMVESDACGPERASSSWFPLSRKRRESVA
jgi:hypothetical protein